MTASEDTSSSMGPRFAGVTWTETSGVGSFSAELQPCRKIAPAKSKTLLERRLGFVPFNLRLRWFMELSAPLSMFEDLPAPRDSGRPRPDRRRLLARRLFARRRLREPWLRHPGNASW